MMLGFYQNVLIALNARIALEKKKKREAKEHIRNVTKLEEKNQKEKRR